MRIFVAEFKQESNSFNPILTRLDDFARTGIVHGNSLLQVPDGEHGAIRGLLDAIVEYGGTPIPGRAMRAKSGGPVEQAVIDAFIDDTLEEIKQNAPIDGAFISLHGATLSNCSDDVCGDILEAIRKQIGKKAILCATCDLHANVTKKMLRNADYITGFHTYPHLDLRQTGYRAGKLGMMRLQKKPIVMACAHVPMIVAASDYTTREGELKHLMDYGDHLVQEGKLLDFSIFQVQPWLDVSQIASAVLTIATSAADAKSCATILAQRQLALRHTLKQPHHPINAIIDEALHNTSSKPVILVDSADSPNAGATGDSAQALRCLLPYKNQLKAAFSINDTPAVKQAFSLGVGMQANFSLGATLAPALTSPIQINARVKSLHDGIFTMEGKGGNRGNLCSIGKTAVLIAGGISILVTEHATRIGDPQFYRGFGIEPLLQDLVVMKACTSFRANYEPLAATILLADTPGAASANLTSLPYMRLPEPLFPFVDISEKNIAPPMLYRTPIESG